jgi:hypothetical protein
MRSSGSCAIAFLSHSEKTVERHILWMTEFLEVTVVCNTSLKNASLSKGRFRTLVEVI